MCLLFHDKCGYNTIRNNFRLLCFVFLKQKYFHPRYKEVHYRSLYFSRFTTPRVTCYELENKYANHNFIISTLKIISLEFYKFIYEFLFYEFIYLLFSMTNLNYSVNILDNLIELEKLYPCL